MKKGLIILFAVQLLACLTVKAQQIYNNNLIINNVNAEQQDKNLTLQMSVNAAKVNLNSQEALVLTPVIKSGDISRELQPLVINGNMRYKASKRTQFFDRNKGIIFHPYTLERKAKSSHIPYTASVEFEDWMRGAHIDLKQEIYGCADCKNKEEWGPLAESINLQFVELNRPDARFVIVYIAPEAEAVKNRNNVGTAYLEFPVGKSVILSDFRNNFRELSKIQTAISQLRDNKDASITSIDLKGFASPEGSSALNERLSQSRAQALKDYLQKEFGYSSSLFNVSSGGEDWGKLKRLIEESNISAKSTLLDIINSGISEDAKEQKIRSLPGGVYNTLFTEYFPLLRRVDYRLNYTVRGFSVEEGREIIKVRPAEMSLNEMFLVANTYQKGSDEFNQVFDIAVRMFPQDVVANLNAAAIVLERNDTAAAHRYLDGYKDIAQSWNNQGILYALEGNIEQAREYFTKAQAEGSSEATENLEKLKLIEEYEAAKAEQERR